MRLGIMQPYVFPYIGYFQLIHSVDKFVCYDDVTFIKQGWINRNRILLNNSDHIFTVPLKSASSYKTIKETEINSQLYPKWRDKFFKTIEQAYKRAPYCETVLPILHDVFDSEYSSISELAMNSIITVCAYLDIDKDTCTSEVYNNTDLSAQERVLDICRQEQASQYINVQGGKELYSKEAFAKEGIELLFIVPQKVEYKQYNEEFTPWLSIIDVLMFNNKAEIVNNILPKYALT